MQLRRQNASDREKDGGEREREREGRTTFTARAQLVTASVPRGTAPTMDAELPVVAAIHDGTRDTSRSQKHRIHERRY